MDYGISGSENKMHAPETAAINDDQSTSDNEEHEPTEFRYEKTGTHQFVPTIAEAEAAFRDIKKNLKPPRKKGTGYDHHGPCTAALRPCDGFYGSTSQGITLGDGFRHHWRLRKIMSVDLIMLIFCESGHVPSLLIAKTCLKMSMGHGRLRCLKTKTWRKQFTCISNPWDCGSEHKMLLIS